MAKLKDLEQRKAQLIAHIGSQRSVSLTPGAEWLSVPSFGGFDYQYAQSAELFAGLSNPDIQSDWTAKADFANW